MALDSLVDSTYLNNGLISICYAIREKTGESSTLSFPWEMYDAIRGLIADSEHFATLLYAVNCKGDTQTTSVTPTDSNLITGYTNKIILQVLADPTVAQLKSTAGLTSVYFIDNSGNITTPNDSDKIIDTGVSPEFWRNWLIGNSATDPTVCYCAESVNAYYTAMQKLLNLI